MAKKKVEPEAQPGEADRDIRQTDTAGGGEQAVSIPSGHASDPAASPASPEPGPTPDDQLDARRVAATGGEHPLDDAGEPAGAQPEAERAAYEAHAKGDPAAAEVYRGEGEHDAAEPPAADQPSEGAEGQDDPRNPVDRSGGSSRGVATIPGSVDGGTHAETDVVRQVSRTNLLDTAHLAHEDREGPGRTLRVEAEPGEGEAGEKAGTAGAAPIPSAEERANLTIFNTRPGDEPGREMRDTTLESGDKGTGPTPSSVPDDIRPVDDTAPGMHRTSGFKTNMKPEEGRPLEPSRIRHAEIARQVLESLIVIMRDGDRGDDFAYARASLNLAQQMLPKAWHQLTGRAGRHG